MHQCIEAANKTVIDLVVEFVNKNRLIEKIIAPINYVRLHKKVILPCEILGLIGDKKTEYWSNAHKQSSLN